MPRPRHHDLDALLDAAEELAVESGPSAITVRALSDSTGVSNGAIYHAFGSRAGLLGHLWLRAAQRFLHLQQSIVRVALDHDGGTEAVVAAADAPAVYLAENPGSARFLLSVRRADLVSADDLPTDLADRLHSLDQNVTALLVELAQAVWGRTDRLAVDVMRDCVVELPTALLLRNGRFPDAGVRDRLAAAVRAVVALDLPPLPERHRTPTKGHTP